MFRRFALALLGLTLVIVTPAPATASVAVSESWNFNRYGNLALKGHGYGHGHGMSQYGAEGAARRGLTESQILSFYYPGTNLARFNSRIAVLISADTTDDLHVKWQPGLVARDRGNGKTYQLPKLGWARWRFVVLYGLTVAQFLRTDGTWQTYRIGEKAFFAGDGQFSAPSGKLSLLLPGGEVREYRGVLRHSRPSAKSKDRDTVNVLGIDAYVRGVVPAEMPATWHPEAVQSQAIAARTYALHERESNLRRHYQICDTTSCQVYRGVGGEHRASNAAVRATARLFLQYEGKPAFTQFSASSGGWTSAGSRPYLVSKADPYDDWSGNQVHDWTVKINRSALQRRYPGLGTVRGFTITRREGGGDWKGRVVSMTIRGTKANRTISGNDFRSIYGLRSTWFTKG